MSIENIEKLLTQNEDLRLEFKESYEAAPKSIFGTICAMLNCFGGDILLGVSNKGNVIGINPLKVDQIKDSIIKNSNNAELIDPPFLVYIDHYNIEKKHILHIQVPKSSQVHRYKIRYMLGS